MTTSITLTVNGVLHTVGATESADTRLVTYLRDTLGLTGTHYTCLQGGCGACTVVATAPDLATGGTTTFSVNSCLASLYNCDGWSITTVEGLGNGEDGYHVIQERLTEYYGTQCGYCSPGMVMNMYGLTQSNSAWTPEDVEKNLDGHICRCTGYRPILSAFKSITPTDIEDSHKSPCLSKASGTGCCQPRGGGCCREGGQLKKEITVNGITWYSPTTIQELLSTLSGLPVDTSYRLLFGNTSVGVYPDPPFSAIISTRNIAELCDANVTTASVTAGAAVTITTLMAAFKQAKEQAGFEYLAHIYDHWQKVASTSVRNLGGWAGNLGLKSHHPEFASDIFLTLVACGAQVLVGSTDGSSKWVTVEALVDMDLTANRDVMLTLRLQPTSQDTVYRSYKVTARSTSNVAYVNAAFNIRVDPSFIVLDGPILALGNINDTFVRASATESYLVGKSLLDEAVLQGAVSSLGAELVPDAPLTDASPQYRKEVAQALLYRTLLSIIDSSGTVDSSILTAATGLQRPLSSGTQTYDDNATQWPLGEPIPKLESKLQCAGEAEYLDDAPLLPGELAGVFLQSTLANAAITAIDTTQALAVEGVVGFVSAGDIRGVNDMQPFDDNIVQPVFADERVSYHGQGIGVLVATSKQVAEIAVKLIEVTYGDERTPILTIEDSIANGLPPNQPDPFVLGNIATGFSQSARIVEGAMSRDGQYHFHMETQAARVVPSEGNFDVYATTQWISGTQAALAQVLNVPSNSINVTVKRLGGGFGGKIVAGNLVSTATAVAAQKFRKPVRISLDLTTNMTMIGWRDPFYFTYKVGVDAGGRLMAVQATLYGDAGFLPIDSSSSTTTAYSMPSCYDCPNWEVTPRVTVTDTACNTWCRTPITLEGITIMEYVLEHAATELGMDPLEFRKLNLIPDGGSRMADTLPVKVRQTLRANRCWKENCKMGVRSVTITKNLIADMISQIEQEADVAARKAAIVQFNLDNRWRKRGLAVMPMLWPYEVPSVYGFGVFIAIYGQDGTIAISHGGIEMGQGINTKVAQVAAYTLGCSVDNISIKPTTTLTGANSSITGGSIGSDVVSYCALHAAAALKTRLDAVAVEGDTWKQTVERAFDQGVNLCEYYWNGPDEVKSYNVFGVACTEVELDVLTGNFLVLRTDILEDAGISSSPLVDIGQIEGSWVFGQGLCTTEGPKYDPATGAKLTMDTWTYKPLMAQDIPTDLRVTLLSAAPNPEGVLSTKVTNEPPLCLAYAVPLALRVAITSARQDAGTSGWFRMDTPLTVDHIQQLCLVDPLQFTYTRSSKNQVTQQ